MLIITCEVENMEEGDFLPRHIWHIHIHLYIYIYIYISERHFVKIADMLRENFGDTSAKFSITLLRILGHWINFRKHVVEFLKSFTRRISADHAATLHYTYTHSHFWCHSRSEKDRRCNYSANQSALWQSWSRHWKPLIMGAIALSAQSATILGTEFCL